MASANLQFKIGSTFSGEGFQKAQTAVGKFKSGIGPTMGAINQLSSSIESVNSVAGKCGTALSNLLGSFAQGGVLGLGFNAAMLVVNKAIEIFNERAKEAAEYAKKLKEATESAITEGFNSRVSSLNDELTTIRSNFELITSSANAFRDAMNGLQSSRAEGGVIALQIEKFNAMLEADSKEMQKDIEATYNLRIAKEQAKKTQEENSAKLKKAADDVSQSESRINTINEEIYRIEYERGVLKRTLMRSEELSADKRKDLNSKLEELDKKEQSLKTEIYKENEKKKTLLVKEQTAIQDSANANNKMTVAVKEAELKIKDLEFSKAEELNKANEEYMKKLEEVSKENFEKLNKELEKNKKALKDANDKVRTAVDNMNAAVKAYNENFTVNEIAAAIQQAMNPAVQGLLGVNNALLGNAQGIAKGAAKVAGQAAIDKGLVKTVAQLKTVEDKAFKDSMKEINSTQTTQMGLEAQRAARLEKMGKAISETDKKWLENYNKVREGNLKQVKAVEEAKKAVADAKKRQDQLQKDVNTIAQALANPQNLAGDIATVKDAVDSSATSIIQAIENKQVNVTVENSGEDSSDSSIDVSGIESGISLLNTSLGEIKSAIENIEFPDNSSDTSSDSSGGDTGSDVDLSGIESGISALTEAVNGIKSKIDHKGIKTEISNVKDNLSNCLQMK